VWKGARRRAAGGRAERLVREVFGDGACLLWRRLSGCACTSKLAAHGGRGSRYGGAEIYSTAPVMEMGRGGRAEVMMRKESLEYGPS
jgi:hypothetical protein